MHGLTKEEKVQFRAEISAGQKESGEVERALFVQPDVADQEDAEKNEHREQREGGQMMREPRAKQDGPGNKKDGFHFEDNEEHGNDVPAGGVTSASAGFGEDAAFVRLKFGGAAAGAGANVFEDNESDDREREYQQGEEEKWDVGGWHRLAYGRMLTQISVGSPFGDPI
jgi:hypothetical protein